MHELVVVTRALPQEGESSFDGVQWWESADREWCSRDSMSWKYTTHWCVIEKIKLHSYLHSFEHCPSWTHSHHHQTLPLSHPAWTVTVNVALLSFSAHAHTPSIRQQTALLFLLRGTWERIPFALQWKFTSERRVEKPSPWPRYSGTQESEEGGWASKGARKKFKPQPESTVL